MVEPVENLLQYPAEVFFSDAVEPGVTSEIRPVKYELK